MRKSVWLFTLLLLCSCVNNHRLSKALELAGSNRGELEKVLIHYKDSGEKYKAACFLIENMPKCYSYKGWLIDTLRYWKATTDSFGIIDSSQVAKWEKYPASMMNKEYDIHVITADYLIRNIDQAFVVWKKRPWNKDLSFDDFCELILPYRIGDETLEDWRSVYSEEFSFLLDSVYIGTDVMEATKVVMENLRERGFRFNNDFDSPHMGALFLLEHRAGKCVDMCDFGLYVLRSLGIPATADVYFFESESRMGHIWDVVRDSLGNFVNINSFHVAKFKWDVDGRRIGKVFRYCYGLQKEKLKFLSVKDEIPPLFRHCFVKDVSEDYFKDDLVLDLSDVEDDYVYLGVFRPQTAGEGVDIAKLRKGKATFNNIEAKMIYMPLAYENSTYKPIGYPFFFDGKEAHPYIPDLSVKDTVVLKRKAAFFDWIRYCFNIMVGSKFKVSNRKDFSGNEPFYCICDTPHTNRTFIHLPEPVKGRYVRFSTPKDIRIELAELSFSYDGVKVNPLKIEGDVSENKYLKIDNIIDGDVLTYYLPKKGGASMVIDFGKEICFNELMYMPRNDDNFVRIGDVYELFYHGGKDGWISLGQKKATDTFLVYDNMPRGALFYLHDITRGKEEQVFRIENGKQVFISNFGK